MANIMINKVCNLACDYCFANDYVNVQGETFNHSKNMSVEDFKKAVDFSVRAGHHRIGIIGGEPTLHPHFKEIVKIAVATGKRVIVFTNGVFIDKHIDVLSHPNVNLLVNFNPPEIAKGSQFAKTRANIIRFIRDGIKQGSVPSYMKRRTDVGSLTVGLNMYKPDFEYQHIIEIAKKTGAKMIRTSIAVPNTYDKFGNPTKDYFYEIKPRMFEFFRALKDIGAIPHFDCNNIPLCCLTPEEYDFLDSFNILGGVQDDDERGGCSHARGDGPMIDDYTIEMVGPEIARLSDEDPRKELLKQQAQKYHDRRRAMKEINGGVRQNLTNLTMGAICSPIIDILPDLSMIRCFGLSNNFVTHVDDFQDDPREVMDYYYNKFDSMAYTIPTFEHCKTCPSMLKRKCMGGCLAFKTTKYEQVYAAMGEDAIGKGKFGQSSGQTFVPEDQLAILESVEKTLLNK